MVAERDGLVGMKEICDYVRRSEPTVLDMIRNGELPAKKIHGIWESSRFLIDEWKQGQSKKAS